MTGDIDDVARRIYATLPTGWLGDKNPVINSIIYGIAYAFSLAYSLYQYAVLQTRLATATDDWLDLFAADFFGNALQRNASESDSAYRARIKAALFPVQGTRAAVSSAIQKATGTPPLLIELNRPADTLAYGIPQFGYGATGFYGSTVVHHQALCIAASTGPATAVYAAVEGVRDFGTAVYVTVPYGSPAIFQALSNFVNVDGLHALAE